MKITDKFFKIFEIFDNVRQIFIRLGAMIYLR